LTLQEAYALLRGLLERPEHETGEAISKPTPETDD